MKGLSQLERLFPRHRKEGREVVPGVLVCRIKLHGSAEVPGRLVERPPVGQRGAKVPMGQCRIGLEPQGLTELPNSLVELPRRRECDAQLVVDVRNLWDDCAQISAAG